MNMTKLVIQNPEKGELKGHCYICGKQTDCGFKFSISRAFTQFSHLGYGDCFCEYCNAFLGERKYRNRSWVGTVESRAQFMKAKELRPFLLDPPDPPFFFYITQGGQRQGWLDAVHCVSHSKEKFYISTDWTPVFLSERRMILEMDSLVTELREKKITKTELRTGVWRMHRYRKAVEEGYEELLKVAETYVNQPLWEVMIVVAQ